jgi:hypothetical protein
MSATAMTALKLMEGVLLFSGGAALQLVRR